MTTSINLLIEEELLAQIEEYRHVHRLKSRLDAIRELLKKGLAVRGLSLKAAKK